MKKNLFETVAEVLKSNSKYVAEDGNLLKAVVYSDVMNMKKELLGLLLSNETIKEKFFEDVNGVLVFDKQKFAWFLESKEFLPDSYTRYTNKIGLTHNGDFISKSNDVVLDFPYKDCMLQGGQDKDDQKRKEIFYNETIASDEVTKMLAPKVFTKAKRYTQEGVEENITFDDNDNLIIKGNNLIALSSLLKRYEGKVKCIYIDPPYNTGSDSFGYNDSFNHSTWLVFMKNRLELAKKLLSDDGLIFVQCDDNEMYYLGCLMDEVFGRDNFVNIITVKTKIGGVSGSSEGKSLKDVTEFISLFSKSKNLLQLNPVYEYKEILGYVEMYKASGKSWKYTQVLEELGEAVLIKKLEGEEYFHYPSAKLTSVKKFADKHAISEDDVYLKYPEKIFRTTNAQSSIRKKVIDETVNFNEGIVSIRYIPKKGKNANKINEVFYNGTNKDMFMFLTEMLEEIDGQLMYKDKLNTLWENIQYNNLVKEGGVELPSGKKPEKLIESILLIATNEKDIVLDFFLGSGSTCAVAHKMGRRYIGIEQMGYIEDKVLTRLNNVINGDLSGISQKYDWQGGGSFVYCELLENAQSLVEQILAANEDNIHKVKDAIYSDERIIPYITRKELADASHEFEALPLEEKKQVLIRLVDKNKLYVNYSDMEDTTFDVSEADKQFTQSFYKEF